MNGVDPDRLQYRPDPESEEQSDRETAFEVILMEGFCNWIVSIDWEKPRRIENWSLMRKILRKYQSERIDYMLGVSEIVKHVDDGIYCSESDQSQIEDRKSDEIIERVD